MRRLALAALLSTGCGRAPEPGPACPHDPVFDRSGVVRVRAEAGPASVRRDLDLAAIAREAGPGAGRPQGLTVIEHRLAYRSLVRDEASNGRTCVWFEEVGADLTPAGVQIFVPSEYPDDSCEHLAVLAHERDHERAHAERLAAAAAEIEAALKAARWLPTRGNPLEAADRAGAEAALDAKVRKVVAPIYARYKEELALAQAELDRPDLYQWYSKRCAGWK